VFAIGFGLLAGGLALIARFGTAAALVGCALAATIVVYDSWHKANPASPLIMGLCRALVYLAAAAALGDGGHQLAVGCGALAMFAHVVGLTYAAKQESLDRLGRLWPLAVLLLPFALLPGLALTPLSPVDAAGPVWPLALLALAALLAADALALRLLVARAARGDVGKAVAQLIAASALVDAAAIALAAPVAGASVVLVAACGGAWALTRFLQRGIPGT
jgi:4-hydroxybenzoate polyprenyltransferase